MDIPKSIYFDKQQLEKVVKTSNFLTKKQYAIFYSAAMRLFDREEYEKACSALYFLSLAAPAEEEVWIALGLTLKRMGEYELAVDLFEYAAIKMLNSPLPYYYLGECLAAINETESALSALEIAEEYAKRWQRDLGFIEKIVEARERILLS